MITLTDAILLYNPNSQFVIINDDYDSLDWHSKDIAKPTLAELESLKVEIENAQKEAKAEAEAKREAALSKLAALGLTADDLRALGL